MSNVKRWKMGASGSYAHAYSDGTDPIEVEESEIQFVLASDYDALAQQLAATQNDRKEWIADVDRLENEARVLRQQLAASQVEVGNLKDGQATITRLESQLADAVGLLSELTNEPFINPGRLKRMNAFLSKLETKENDE
jgi:uncharacterized coiled-coil DUF342 family protein